MEHLLPRGRARGIKSSLLSPLIVNFSSYKRPQIRVISLAFSLSYHSKPYQFDFENMSVFRPILSTSSAATTGVWIIVITSLGPLQSCFHYSCPSGHSTRKSGRVSPRQEARCLRISGCPGAPVGWPGLPALVSSVLCISLRFSCRGLLFCECAKPAVALGS